MGALVTPLTFLTLVTVFAARTAFAQAQPVAPTRAPRPPATAPAAAPTARPSPSGAAPSTQGTVQGRVLDKSTGDPIIEAGVEVVQTGKRVRTDLDGKYSLRLPPGTYELRVFAPLYVGTRLQNVVVKPNLTTVADTNLKPEAGAGVEVVEVVAEAKKAAEATQLLERKASDVVEDNIGAQTIAKSPDSDAAEIATRLPAVTIEDGKFVYVRGLSERYSYGLLNRSRLPSTDPNVRVVPLDLFPADFIDALSVVKTYSPDLPGDFSGGLVDITLEEAPDRLTYGGGFTLGFNTNSTFQDFLTYQGSSLDYFGFGSGYRALPAIIPSDPRVIRSQATQAQDRVYASAFRNIWTPQTMTAPPNFRIQGSVGNKWGPLGGTVSVTYGTKYVSQPNTVDQVMQQPGTGGTIELRQSYSGPVDTFSTNLGALLTSGYDLSTSHRLGFRTFVNRNTSDQTAVQTGFDTQDNGLDSTATSLEYTEDQLAFGQLTGRHRWDWLSLDWRTALSQTTEQAPDNRYYRYAFAPGAVPALDIQGASGRSPTRTFLDLDEYLTDSAIDADLPFKTALPYTDVWRGLDAHFRFGPAYMYRDRNVNYRVFVYDNGPNLSNSGIDLSRRPEAVLWGTNLGPLVGLNDLSGICSPSNPQAGCQNFEASQEVAAFYGLLELPLLQDVLRLNAGVRTEYSYIRAKSARQTNLNNLDPLPGVNLIWSPRTDMTLRAGYSQTVSRPDFRELDPTLYITRPGDPPTEGNQDLVSGSIDSFDLRWDWFFSPVELASISVFYKDLANPIEDVLNTKSSSTVITFVNAESASLYGAEFEVRKNFGFVGPWAARQDYTRWSAPYFANLNLNVNVSLIDSTVDISPDARIDITNRNRPLQGQAPYTINANLEYDFGERGIGRLLYTTAGRSIAYAGVNGLDDEYQEPRNQLDLVLLWRFRALDIPLTGKFSVENMLNDRYLDTQNGFITSRFRTGATFNVGLSYLLN